MLLGLRGTSPGKAALGLRVVHTARDAHRGRPALLRSLILGVAALPTFGLGVATLAWTAVMDRDRQRRGWHDHVADSIVVDVRPVPVAVEQEAAAPRQIVNLTAMRLVPAPAGPRRDARPSRGRSGLRPRPRRRPRTGRAGHAPPPARRRPLGPPLVDQPAAAGPAAVAARPAAAGPSPADPPPSAP